MRELPVTYDPEAPTDLAAANDAPVADGETVLVDETTGHPVAVQFRLPPPIVEPLRSAVRRLKFTRLARPGGMANEARTFGYSGRMPARGYDACRASVLAVEQPQIHAALAGAAPWLAAEVARLVPDAFTVLELHATEIHPDWRLAGSPWTSGTINNASALRLHRDTNNTPTWSVMPVFRRKMAGGHLWFPHYRVALATPDAHAVTFSGAKILHGVTGLTPSGAGAYRLSVPYYQIASLKACLPCAEELAAAAEQRTGRERLWGLVEAGDPEAEAEAAERVGLDVEEFRRLRTQAR